MAQAQSLSPIKFVGSPIKSNGKRTDFSIASLLKNQPKSNPSSNSNSEDEEKLTMDQEISPNDHLQVALMNSRELCDKSSNEEARFVSDEEKDMATFSWLACTRFKPPKLPRSKKKAGCMRHGRGPRIPFAPHQIAVLESTFSKSQYLSSDCIHRLADTLHLSETRVKIWFQNRRARYRREREPPSPVPGIISQAQNLKNGDSKTLSPRINTNLDSGMIYSNTSSISDLTNTDDLNQRKCFSKRKLLIPDFISMQIQHHRHAQQLQYYLQQGFSPPNSPLLQTALQTSAAAHSGFPWSNGLIPDFSSGFNNAEATAQFSRFLSANGNSPFVPVSVPMQISFP